jgi:hypothetical protein
MSALLHDLAAFVAMTLFIAAMAVGLPELSSAIHSDRQQIVAQAAEE